MGSQSYYDVDAILTDAQKVPCTFELTVPGLGYLEGNMTGDIQQGSKVELPLWLGEMLALRHVQPSYVFLFKRLTLPHSQSLNTSSLVTLDHPSALAPRVLNALKADPRTVDLRALAPHFYSLGARILDLFEEDDMVHVLSETFKARAAVIAGQAHNPRGALGEGADFMRGLDETERKLFRDAHDSAKAVRTWITDLKKK
ncbi:GINS complex, Psf3 component [Westerdykella ornata]|uniref:DNA replication complex GINS protein PSF3 n=1 Tax=Westerdykella ornata TaxID=318751 RepID=A0A6A6JEM1_WESOR|nr:GINS complex, Psf3 component [Westerdykella ornata]KAF2274747.1 GINS complex, Psf3 component [Westerdykella ornata]